MKFINCGTNIINEFNGVCNIEGSYKPAGGMWFTTFNEQFMNYNEWIDFLLANKSILYAKHKDIFNINAVIVSLKNDTNLLYINSIEDYDKYAQIYGNGDKFNYELLNRKFDGIYFNIFNIHGNCNLGARSLLLFHSDAILEYQSAIINIEDFTDRYYDSPFDILYNINVEQSTRYIEKNYLRNFK